jgi:hypothetical protein
MKLYVIFGQRHESYEGEFAPEVIDCWDEYAVDGNYEGYEEQLNIAESNKEFSAVSVVVVEIDGNKVSDRLRKPLELTGEIK